ncbi:hypothetical protein [Winogradskyella sp.]|uniref:hypothetical protein n=1 Tax=Winogradskyella sp. TaxID=1883156 RepID=UPI003F6CDF53
MTRQEHLKLCKSCINRDMDLKAGLVCKLTGKIADFDTECPSYKLDENHVAQLDNENAIERHQIVGRLSKKNLEKLKTEQSLPAAIFAGSFIGVVAAAIWAAVTVSTNMKIGLVAIAIGALVGLGMRFIGKGIDPIFGICGGIIAFLSCVLGDFFSIIGFVAEAENLNYFETFLYFDYSLTFEILKETASPMDLIFYAIAAAEGYKFSFRKLTEKELYNLEHKKD